MARTKGAKGKPKDPGKEFEKVKKLCDERGVSYPWENTAKASGGFKGKKTGSHATKKGKNGGLTPPKSAADPPPSEVSGQDVTFTMNGKKDNKTTYKCGHCERELPDPVEKCPFCGASLQWT